MPRTKFPGGRGGPLATTSDHRKRPCCGGRDRSAANVGYRSTTAVPASLDGGSVPFPELSECSKIQAEKSDLLDHLIGAREQRGR